MYCKNSLYITINHIITIAQIYYYCPLLATRNNMSQSKSPATGYFTSMFH